MRFGGQILYSRTSTDVEKAAMELRRVLDANRSEAGQVTVGFDIEWKPTFRKGNSVFQILQVDPPTHVIEFSLLQLGIPTFEC